jgi:hypothetical protein
LVQHAIELIIEANIDVDLCQDAAAGKFLDGLRNRSVYCVHGLSGDMSKLDFSESLSFSMNEFTRLEIE